MSVCLSFPSFFSFFLLCVYIKRNYREGQFMAEATPSPPAGAVRRFSGWTADAPTSAPYGGCLMAAAAITKKLGRRRAALPFRRTDDFT